jgi:peptide/nickel transport system permease protein
VAVVRLGLGLGVGMVSGWSTGWLGRLLKGVTGAALAVPVLLAGLAVNAALNVRLGTWAFVLGLALTGWAETARLVREQTILVRTQPYVEAARALGASGTQIVFRHVLTQIAPLIWMLWAFEISGTLLITAVSGVLHWRGDLGTGGRLDGGQHHRLP